MIWIADEEVDEPVTILDVTPHFMSGALSVALLNRLKDHCVLQVGLAHPVQLAQ